MSVMDIAKTTFKTTLGVFLGIIGVVGTSIIGCCAVYVVGGGTVYLITSLLR